MEDYVATDQRPVTKCLQDVGKAVVYIGLFGFRYGYIPPPEHNNPEGLSITELEFREAERLAKPCLTFVLSEDVPLPPKFVDSLTEGRISQLRDYLLREKMVKFFSAPYELSSLVQSAVTKCLADKKVTEPLGQRATSRHYLGHQKTWVTVSRPHALHQKVRTGVLRP
jgi:hypothetical protein